MQIYTRGALWQCKRCFKKMHSGAIVLAAVSKFGFLCAFLDKSDCYQFSTRKYIPFKIKDVSFFHAVLTSQWRHWITYCIFKWIKQLISSSAVNTYINRILMLFIALKWTKMSIGGPNWKMIQRGLQFYVKMTSIWCHYAGKNILCREI